MTNGDHIDRRTVDADGTERQPDMIGSRPGYEQFQTLDDYYALKLGVTELDAPESRQSSTKDGDAA